MRPRDAGSRGRGRDRGRGRGRGHIPAIEEEAQAPVAPGQGAHHEEETKTPREGRRGKSLGAPQEGSSKKMMKGSSSALPLPSFQPSQSSQGSSAPRQARRPEVLVSPPIFCYKCKQPGHRRAECPQNTRRPKVAVSQPIFCHKCKRSVSQPIYCYKCKLPGHKRAECPRNLGQAESVGQTQERSVEDVRACYGCGQPGHIRKFCPFAQGGALEGGQVQQLVTGQPGQPSESQPVPQPSEGPARVESSGAPPFQKGEATGQGGGGSLGTPASGRVYAVAQQEATTESILTKGTFSTFSF